MNSPATHKGVLIGLDTETTGVNPAKDDPVQVALVSRIFAGGEVSTPCVLYNSMCQPSVSIDPEAEKIHGISEDMTRYSPSPSTAVKTMGILVKKAEVMGDVYTVGYNSTSFDIPLLSRFDSSFYTHKHIDVYTLCLRHLHSYGTTLTDLYTNYIGKEPENAHDAVVDILLTLEVLEKYLKQEDTTVVDVHNYLSTPMVYEVFPFGKYKGQPVGVVPASYAKWCLNNFDSVGPDLHLTLELIAKG